MGRPVLVTWDVSVRHLVVAKPADHFHLTLSVHEGDVPVSARNYTFADVEFGQLSGTIVVCDVDGTELASVVEFAVDVADTGTDVPVPVNVSGVAQ